MKEDEFKIMLHKLGKIINRYKVFISLVTLLFLIISAINNIFFVKPIYQQSIQFSLSQLEGDEHIFDMVNIANSSLQNLNLNISSENPPVNIEDLVTKYKKNIINDPKLSGNVDVNLIPNTKIIGVTVRAKTQEEVNSLSAYVNSNFEQFVYQQNLKELQNRMNSAKRSLDLIISILSKQISRAENDLAKIDKTVDYGKGIIEPNPSYTTYLENISKNRLLLNNSMIQKEEMGQIEKMLPQMARETGLMVLGDTAAVQKSPSNVVTLIKIILSGIAGFLISLFLIFTFGSWKREK